MIGRILAALVSIVLLWTSVAPAFAQQVAAANVVVLKNGKVASDYSGFPRVAQFIPPPFLTGKVGKTLTWVNDETNPGSCTSPCTFNRGGSHYNTAAGTYSHAVIYGQGSGIDVTSVTICGSSATLTTHLQPSGTVTLIATANAVSSTCDVVVTYNGNPGRSSVSVYYSTGLASATASSATQTTCSHPCSTTVTALAGGFVIASAVYQNGATTVWSGGVTKDFGVNIGSGAMNVSSASASNTSAGSFTPSWTDSAGAAEGIAAAAY